MRTVGMYLAELLEAYGVEVIFGIPGVHTVELYRGLPNTKLRHITPRHEQGAGFMADGYARVSGRLGVCEGPSGGGATYIVPGVAEAHGSAIPLLHDRPAIDGRPTAYVCRDFVCSLPVTSVDRLIDQLASSPAAAAP